MTSATILSSTLPTTKSHLTVSMASDLNALLAIFWLSLLILSHPLLEGFSETFALDISNAFDRAWHKALISKLPSFGFYPSLCSFVSNFLSDRSIEAVVDSYCSSPKPINRGVSLGSVQSTHSFSIIHQRSSQSYSASYHVIYTDDYLALLHIFLQTPKPETGK